jgi:hypothetical protein
MTKLAPVTSKPSHSASHVTKAKKASASHAPKKLGIAELDHPSFAIGSIRAERGFASELDQAYGDGISGHFPLEKLSTIKTPGRHAIGFRLDGGSVRFLWVSARRIEESEHKGYEIFFWAQGKAVSALEARKIGRAHV